MNRFGPDANPTHEPTPADALRLDSLVDEAAAAERFAAGEYVSAFRRAASEPLRGSALIMMGIFEQGLALIGSPREPRELFTSAVACWGLSRGTKAAMELLDRVPPESCWAAPTARLRTILLRERMQLVIQGRQEETTNGYTIVNALKASPRVDIVSVGQAPLSDIVIAPTDGFESVMARLPAGWDPDAWLCHMVEDHPPPIGIERAAFPTLFHTQDYDRHFHHVRNLLPLFDASIALGRADHADLLALAPGSKSFIFPMLIGLPPVPEGVPEPVFEKNIDLYVSGNNFRNNEGKSRLLYQISQLPLHYKIIFKDGYESETEYNIQYNHAKCTVGYVNRWGLVNGRCLEAIASGCVGLYQEGGEIGVVLGEADGAVPYSDDNVLQQIADVVDNFDTRFASRLHENARKTRNEFNINRCMDTYAVMLAAYVALTGRPRLKPAMPGAELRYPNRSPHRTPYFFGSSERNLAGWYLDHWRTYGSRWDYSGLDLMGESYLYSTINLPNLPNLWNAPGPTPLEWAEDVYRRLVAEHPTRLAARFNLARILRRAGKEHEALAHFGHITDAQDLVYEPEDLLFWREVDDELFDYDLLMRESVSFGLTRDPACLHKIAAAIRESALCYLLTRSDLIRPEERTTYFERAIAIGVNVPQMVVALCSVGSELGRTAESVQAVIEFLSRKPWAVAVIGEQLFESMRLEPTLRQQLLPFEHRYLRLKMRRISVPRPKTLKTEEVVDPAPPTNVETQVAPPVGSEMPRQPPQTWSALQRRLRRSFRSRLRRATSLLSAYRYW